MITLEVHNRIVKIVGADRAAIRVIDKATSYLIEGHYFAPAFKSGFWDGREKLLKQSASGIWTYSGLVLDIAKALREAGHEFHAVDKTKKGPRREMVWSADVVLRPYQERVVGEILSKPFRGIGTAVMPIRSGKSKTMAKCLHLIGRSALVIVPSKLLLHQMAKSLAECFPQENIGIIGDSVFHPEFLTVATVQSLHSLRGLKDQTKWKQICEDFEVMVLDECFVAGTMIDGRPIETIRVGDLVWSFNERMVISRQRVLRLFKSRPSSLVVVRLSDGRKLVCTPGHPFRTRRGWVSAIDLATSDVVLSTTKGVCREVHELRIEDRSKLNRKPSERTLEEARENLLLHEMRTRIQRATFKGQTASEVARNASGVCFKAVGLESYEVGSNEGKVVNHVEGKQARSGLDQRRKREALASSASDASVGTRLVNGILRLAWKASRWIPYQLQAGSGLPGIDDWNRGRRGIAQEPQGARIGRQEKEGIDWIGVESVEIQERGSDGEFGGLCPGGVVYNLEVENNHTYVANGIGVHNCHHARGGGDWHNVFVELDARYRLGFSATLFEDLNTEQGRGIIWSKAACGPVRARVTTTELVAAGYLMRQNVIMYKVTEPTAYKLAGWSQTMATRCIHENAVRNGMIAKLCDDFRTDGRRIIVCVNRKNHIAALADALDNLGVDYRVMTGSDSQSKREDIIDGLVAGDFNVVIGTVLREGVDIPAVDVVINAEGGRDLKNTIQRQRNLTVSNGKTQAVFIDFMDNTNRTLAKHSRARLKAYKSESTSSVEVRDWG